MTGLNFKKAEVHSSTYPFSNNLGSNSASSLRFPHQAWPGDGGSLVAYSRVYAFIQAHDFLDAYQAALDDGIFSHQEPSQISRQSYSPLGSLYLLPHK
jgi:hypothetical protein